MSRIVKPAVYRHIRTLGNTAPVYSGSASRKVVMVVSSEKYVKMFESIRGRLDMELEIIGARFLSHPSAFGYVVDLMCMCDATLICMEDSECLRSLKNAMEPYMDELKVVSIGVDASVWYLTTVDRKLATECYRSLLEGGDSGYVRMLETLEDGLGWKRLPASN